MPIKWSAVKVSEAMDEVEQQVTLADQFIAEARVKVAQAQKIANLPQYIDQRLSRLDDQLERLNHIKEIITRVREDIPAKAIEAERESTKHGSTQSLI